MPKFDAIVANPPFSYRWTPKDEAGEDMRFEIVHLLFPPLLLRSGPFI